MIITQEMLNDGRHITSLEIASITGKLHKNVMQAIRNMEPAWLQERGLKFQLSQIQERIPNGGYKLRPCYLLDKEECLFVSTKFNDVARARLVLRWAELESAHLACRGQAPCALLETEADIMKRCDEIRKQEICLANENAMDCFTMTQVARSLRMGYRELCQLLEENDVIFNNKGTYELLPPYNFMGYEAYRHHEGYKLDGNRRQKKYMVWTPEGMEFVKNFIKST